MKVPGVLVGMMLALAALAAPAVGPAAPAGAAPDPGVPVYDGADFQNVPDPLPSAPPGQLIRVQRVADVNVGPGELWRVMYHSRSRSGADIAVTGLLAMPTETPAPPGGRPVVSWAHGTAGLADGCAPSRTPAQQLITGMAGPLLERGYVVAATDYEGLGTPGLHPYLVGQSEARGVIDIVRAARQFSSEVGNRFATWGHSQGGHAALFAGQISPSWAPELELVGTVAAAPATELPLAYPLLKDSPFRHYLVMAAAGINAAYPEARLDQVLTDLAIQRIGIVDAGCTQEVRAVYSEFTTEQLAKADPNTIEPWRSILLENNPGQVRSAAPVLLVHGEADEQVPAVASQMLFDRMCPLGQPVERRLLTGVNHSEVVPMTAAGTMAWIGDRFAGTATSGCVSSSGPPPAGPPPVLGPPVSIERPEPPAPAADPVPTEVGGIVQLPAAPAAASAPAEGRPAPQVAARTGTLARTGSDSGDLAHQGLTLVGAGLVALGLATVVRARTMPVG